jgi:hypothetical protein
MNHIMTEPSKVTIHRQTAEYCLRLLQVDIRPVMKSAAEAPTKTEFQREIVEQSIRRLRGLDSLIADLEGALK